jgi:hypothetical protein
VGSLRNQRRYFSPDFKKFLRKYYSNLGYIIYKIFPLTSNILTGYSEFIGKKYAVRRQDFPVKAGN